MEGYNWLLVSAVLLKSGKQEFLLQIINIQGKLDATKQANAIISVLNQYVKSYSNIVALVFDTTSLNTGLNNGIVGKLETAMSKKLL